MNMHSTSRQTRSALSLMLTLSVLLASGASASADLSDLHKAVQEKLPEIADNVQNAIHDSIENSNFDVEYLQGAINSVMESTMGTESEQAFEGLFADMILDSTKLGNLLSQRLAEHVVGLINLSFIEIGSEIVG